MIEHTQPESLQDFEDRRKVAELCSRSIAKLWSIMGQLEQIRDIVDAIDIPTLSSYKKVSELSAAGTAVPRSDIVAEVIISDTAQQSIGLSSFKPPQKKDLASLTLTLAKNLEMQLGQKKE